MNWKQCSPILFAGICFAQSGTNSSKLDTSLNQLTQPSSAPVVPNPNRYDPAKIEAVNELHDYQIKDLMTKVANLESTRTWMIGLTARLGIGVALIVWLRRDIVRKLVSEAFPLENPLKMQLSEKASDIKPSSPR